MTRQQEIVEGLTKLEKRKTPWQQSRDQKAPGAVHRWWVARRKEKPGLEDTLKLRHLDREWICEQARIAKPSGYVGKLGVRWVIKPDWLEVGRMRR